MPKQPFDIDRAMELVAGAVEPYPKAALFELYQEGYQTPFEILVACIISIRTRDETTLPLARRLFAEARTPQETAALSPARIDELIIESSFHERKAQQIRDLALRVLEAFGGELPCTQEDLMSFSGVGVKCANLTLGLACGTARVSADVHVDRITNRWGYVQTKSPEATSARLEEVLPERYWVEINRLLVPFGKHICTGSRPRCSSCPLLDMCAQVGVENPR